MPFLRFTRDKRGYENTYVLQAPRRGHGDKAPPRILYWFRTPPNVKMGRLPLDEDAIRAIEEANPDIEFDWPKMLKLQVKTPPLPPRPERRRERPEGRRRGATSGRPAEGAASRDMRAGEDLREERMPEPFEPEVAGALPGAEAVEPEGMQPAVESAEAALSPEAEQELVGLEEVEGPGVPHPVEALIGAEGLARLRALYAELQARISETVHDPVNREMLRIQLEGLNPDTWATEAEARERLEHFEQQADVLRSRLGRRRRRSRRGGRGRRKGGGRSQPAAQTGPAQVGAGGQEPAESGDVGPVGPLADDEPEE